MDVLDINCDLGEGMGNEEELMPLIQSCNIACGGHAGNEQLMESTVQLAIQNKVNIGAHPSYPDKENFGRKTMVMEEPELTDAILMQLNSLNVIIDKQGGILHHIKPHGALYHDLARIDDFADLFLNIISNFRNRVKLFVPPKSFIAKNALKKGFSIVYEAFADRNYHEDLSLVSRNHSNAIITDPELVAERILKMSNEQKVVAISGKEVPFSADTFCVHSDNKNAFEILKRIHLLTEKRVN